MVQRRQQLVAARASKDSATIKRVALEDCAAKGLILDAVLIDAVDKDT